MATLLLINDKSGTVLRAGVDHCRDLVHAGSGAAPADTIVGQPAALIAAAESAARDPNVDRVLLIAGDGTAAAIAGILAGTDTMMVPLPGGTMNMLARDLGFSNDLEAAIQEMARARPARIDVAFVNDRAFLNNVVFGAFSTAAESREAIRDAETLAETASATAEFISAVAEAKVTDYTIVIDGSPAEASTNMLMIANNLYSGSEELRPVRDRLDGAKLGVYVPQAKDVIDFLAVIYKAVAGDLAEVKDIRIETCNRCTVSSPEMLAMTVDGEVMEMPSPAQFSIKPKSLHVLSLRGTAAE